ncbi:MAG: hypothetical protein Q9216_001584 [Gyalolechia sp. 2 TL-2023]
MAFTMPTFIKTLKGINIWKLLAIIFALLNLKHLPFAWHLRILNGLLAHLPLTARRLRAHKTQLKPSALFQPMVLASRAQPFETDYNLHKSNSTYFSDFDIARLHLMIRLFAPAIASIGEELWLADGKRGPRQVRIIMGGVSCNFRREIRPLRAFEMWSRTLCWDRKWFYVVTFFVEKGVVEPKGWTLQPWKRRRSREGKSRTEKKKQQQQKEVEEEGTKSGGEGEEKPPKGPHPAIFATGIAKYTPRRPRPRQPIPQPTSLRQATRSPPRVRRRRQRSGI